MKKKTFINVYNLVLCVAGSMLLPGSGTSSRTSVDTGTQDSFIYPRRVLVIRAGPRPRRHACVLLNKRTASTLEHVLSNFASAVTIESGHVKQLYGVNTGIQVRIGLQLYVQAHTSIHNLEVY